MPLIQAEGVSKVFGEAPESALPLIREGLDREAIQERSGQTVGVADVSFQVERGEILVIMGLSGSGKSTLVRCINRLIEPTAGSVRVDGEDIGAMDRRALRALRRERVSMVFQHFALFPHRTVLENATYGLEVQGRPGAERRRKGREVLELVGLEGHEDSRPAQLSGGMQQRVGLARALAGDPEIILMDEAVSALDPLIRKEMQRELIELQHRLQKTIVFITHDLNEAVRMGDRIVLMKGGRVVQTGTAEEVLANPASAYVAQFVEDVDMATVVSLESVMRPREEMTVHRPGDDLERTLAKMRRAGLSTLFAVDDDDRLLGVVRVDNAARLARSGLDRRRAARELVEPEPRRLHPDANLQAALPLVAGEQEPVAVVGAQGELLGAVEVGALLAGLAEGVAEPEQPALVDKDPGTAAEEHLEGRS